MDISNKNKLQTHQDMDSRHMQRINCSDKTYWDNTLFSINIIIDDRPTFNVNKVYLHVHDFGGKYLYISNYRGSFHLIISKTK